MLKEIYNVLKLNHNLVYNLSTQLKCSYRKERYMRERTLELNSLNRTNWDNNLRNDVNSDPKGDISNLWGEIHSVTLTGE